MSRNIAIRICDACGSQVSENKNGKLRKHRRLRSRKNSYCVGAHS